MANPSKAKGTRFESEVVQVFRDAGFPHVERRALAGNLDKGDLTGIPGVVVEIKATKSIDLGGGMREAEREAANAGCSTFVLVNKRRQKSASHAYATLPLYLFAELLLEAGYG